MRKRISLYARSALSLLHIAAAKLFNIRGFFSAAVQDFSCGTRFAVNGGGKIFLKKHIHTVRNVLFDADGGVIEVGEGSFFNSGCMVVSKELVTVGNYTSFGPNTFVYDHDHNIKSSFSIHDSGFATSPVHIGSNVWIGANCVILRGTTLGDGCVVGAGSVIKGVYPPGAVIIQRREETVRMRESMSREDVEKVD
ncbi:MAG: acyltransferase [Oscillospiraceae bacterium]|nr:acyltransferase [Oscillospiraceae bacterium]